MNSINVRDTSRPKLSLRYGAINTQRGSQENSRTGLMATTELQRLVATMID